MGRLAAVIEAQRPNLPLWIPVLYAIGIGGYFALPQEPAGWMLATLAACLAIGLLALFPVGPMARLLILAILLPAVGLGAAALRSRLVAAPILPYPMMVNVEGRIIDLDRSASDLPRVLLDRVMIYGLEPDRTPARVRISLDPSTPLDVLKPGQRIIGYARLSPPPAPAEPGGFDFRRIAWFDRIGALGFARTPMVEAERPHPPGLRQLAFRIRMASSAHIQRLVPGQDGAFTSAILTGDRSGIDRSVETALRISSLYHIVSISGLHMALLAAAVFAMIRYGIALVPPLALRWPSKKIAAWAALAAGGAYLVISGCDVATQRSYVMTATVLVAVLLDRPALTLRSAALAAIIVLVVAPESLMEAGFQMSFAATIALVAAFEGLRGQRWWAHTQTAPGWRFVRPVLGIAMTSLVAGAATAPFAAFHFNTVAQYGLIANLLAIPAMGLVVMPAAVVGVLLAPLGLDWLPFQIAGLGMGYVIAVAHFVASLGGAVVGVPAGPPASLGMIVLGGVVLVIWAGRGRWAGLAPMALGAMLWAGADRPDILIADSGRLFGVRTEAGRALSSATGNGFAASSWLENDGDLADQPTAFARAAMARGRGRAEIEIAGLGLFRYVGSKAPDERTRNACREAAILLAPDWRDAPSGDCLFIGADRLRRDGALAIRLAVGAPEVSGAKALNRGRPWTADPARRRAFAPVTAGPKIAQTAAD